MIICRPFNTQLKKQKLGKKATFSLRHPFDVFLFRKEVAACETDWLVVTMLVLSSLSILATLGLLASRCIGPRRGERTVFWSGRVWGGVVLFVGFIFEDLLCFSSFVCFMRFMFCCFSLKLLVVDVRGRFSWLLPGSLV